MISSDGSVGNLLRQSCGDEFVLSVDAKEVEPRQGTELLRTSNDFFLQVVSAWLSILGIIINGAAVLRLRKGHSINAGGH